MEDLTPRWFAHYYEWRNDSAGRERLVPRTNAGPLPHAGRLEPHTIRLAGRSGASEYPTMTYVLRPATEGLVDALEQFAVARFGTTRGPRANAYARERLQSQGCPGGMEAKVCFGSENGVPRPQGHSTAPYRTAERFGVRTSAFHRRTGIDGMAAGAGKRVSGRYHAIKTDTFSSTAQPGGEQPATSRRLGRGLSRQRCREQRRATTGLVPLRHGESCPLPCTPRVC